MYKLYGKVKSDVSEGGQGGREYLDIEINYGYNTIMRVLVKPREDGGLDIYKAINELRDGWTLLKAYSPAELPALDSARP